MDSKFKPKHGHASPQTPTYRSWASMMRRCYNPAEAAYPKYGGKGIKVDDSWHDFEVFLKDMGIRPEGTSLDRKKSTEDYGPGKCRWATPQEQQNNRSNNRLLEFGGVTLTVSQMARAHGFDPKVLIRRLHRGWTLKRALETPVHD